MITLPRFLNYENYEVLDIKEYLTEGYIEIVLEKKSDAPWICHRCGTELHRQRGGYYTRIEELPIMGYRCYLKFKRIKGHCEKCKKARSEMVEFISKESPHLTADYAWWVGRLCEIAAISRVAEMMEHDEMGVWRLDLRRMQRMLAHYRIPDVKKISVDEVYARKKPKFEGESRDDRFFTVITDLETRRVIWVADSRRKEALDQFFILIGEEACKNIEVVTCDQHEGYAASTRQYCKNAAVVWDKFHIMQNFEVAVNEVRKDLYEELGRNDQLKSLTRGKYRFLFLKKASRRTKEEEAHINDVLSQNEQFAKLEIIKERMLSFFYEPSEEAAKEVFDTIGSWIYQAGFKALMKWHDNLEKGWETLKNYFKYRVTSALSEGQNNVIKSIKRRGFGYRNMEYFKLKILQVCGYLNSRFIKTENQLVAQI